MTATTERPLTQKIRADGSFLDLRTYAQAGGYRAIRTALNGGMTAHAVKSEVKDANQRGPRRSGFLNWFEVVLRAVWQGRGLMERDPQQLIEGENRVDVSRGFCAGRGSDASRD